MIEFTEEQDRLVCHMENEVIILEPWGADGIRVRATMAREIDPGTYSALINQGNHQSEIKITSDGASLQNGDILASMDGKGRLGYTRVSTGQELLCEHPIHPISIPARVYKSLQGNLFHVDCNFKSYDGEKIFGLGQHQHGRLDQKGCVIELIQRNAEITIPFLVSSRGYGFLWNNPAIGRVELGCSATHWVAEATPQMDYWVTTGKDPADILAHYADVTGHAPEFPEWASGYWQSKLRYASQAELEATALEYKKRGLPLSVIVVDFFHWTRQGDWQFDPVFWPDPAGMVKRMEAIGVKVMVSVWPTVNRLSKNFSEMWRKNYIIRNKQGAAAQMYFVDNKAEDGIYVHYYDSTHPGARKFVWDQVKDGYYKYGLKVLWLDACEPEMLPFNPENLLFDSGDGQAVANIYPLENVRGFYDGMKEAGEKEPFFLCRSAWAGSQRYGAAVWSGDIYSTFESLRAQVRAGLNMAMSGIPWWTTDIGGFRGGNPDDPIFQQLMVRWFQYAAFCPIFRNHGHRQPNTNDFNGAANEVWSFGDDAYGIIKEYMRLREGLRPYIKKQMTAASVTGLPLMRPLFVDFPSDMAAYDVEDQFMFGPDYLVAPVLDQDAVSRIVYLPAGSTWTDAWTGVVYEGGRRVEVSAPLAVIPVFTRGDASLPLDSREIANLIK
jgi:alpha-D-xyloside xylohydrolase